MALARILATLLLMSCAFASEQQVAAGRIKSAAKLITAGKIAIFGVVRNQGEYPVGGNLSLQEAIAKAGGVDAQGWKKAQLTRGDKVYVLNNNKEDGTFALRAGDIVHVAPSCWGP